jgi:radical SAM protein with 4Fe4S-binding SPASM domain
MKLNNLKIKFTLRKNRFLNKTFITSPRDVIFIDPTGLCNLACRFCAYPKIKPGYAMDIDFFKKIVDEVSGIGFKKIFITPMLGDAFMDKTILEKMNYLEQHDKINEFGLYTNFVLVPSVENLFEYSKLKEFAISLYGINEEDFILVTRKGKKQFESFLKNFKILTSLILDKKINCKIHISIRSKVNDELLSLNENKRIQYILNIKTEITDLIKNIYKFTNVRISHAITTDTWLNTVTQKDVDPLGLKVSKAGPMLGPCNLIFNSIQIRYDGTVHACTRSVGNKLKIGDLKFNKINEILSYDNYEYKSLIEEQMKNKFSEECKSCAHYRSIYKDFKFGHGTYGQIVSLDKALEIIKNT